MTEELSLNNKQVFVYVYEMVSLSLTDMDLADLSQRIFLSIMVHRHYRYNTILRVYTIYNLLYTDVLCCHKKIIEDWI
uniref:Uncharacterized protein n=1 Tax=Octopus bimaculoides TaxID=37653 RepID=A0A0L8GGB6_OCTBM